MNAVFPSVQFELLLPFQLRSIINHRPVAYIPLGTCEWHGEHLPVGLDGLTAHGLCLRAAAKDGGVVLPPLYHGTGGGHGAYPWTIINPRADEIQTQIMFTLERLQTFGFKLAVLFSGHFADKQLSMIDGIATNWNLRNTALKIFSTAVDRIENLHLGPDHAGIFETTLLAALWPDLVQIERLSTAPLNAGENDFGDARHNPDHPLSGIFGPDPRLFKMEEAKPLLDSSVAWLVGQVQSALPIKG